MSKRNIKSNMSFDITVGGVKFDISPKEYSNFKLAYRLEECLVLEMPNLNIQFDTSALNSFLAMRF